MRNRFLAASCLLLLLVPATAQNAAARINAAQSCNGVGNICGAPVLRDGGSIHASQNCCNGMKEVCKLDSSGIPRCFGGQSGNCPTGYTGQAGCCIATGGSQRR